MSEGPADDQPAGTDSATSGSTPPNVVDGDSPLQLPGSLAVAERAEESDLVTKTVGFECTSGELIEGSWTGIPADDFAVAAEMPDSTTHIRIVSRDGFVAVAPVTALDGAMIAFTGRGEPATDLPRFVSPSVTGPRAVKQVARIEPLALDPSEDREAYEERSLD